MQKTTHVIKPGDYKVTSCERTDLSAILGSCVAACIWDPVARVGGMNHILLPNDPESIYREADLRQSAFAMEILLNTLRRNGAQDKNMKVALLGGANMFAGQFNVGSRNTKFANWFVQNEGLNLAMTCLGGTSARKVVFSPSDGRIKRTFACAETSQRETRELLTSQTSYLDQGRVELF